MDVEASRREDFIYIHTVARRESVALSLVQSAHFYVWWCHSRYGIYEGVNLIM
jgi:hypothetical protein